MLVPFLFQFMHVVAQMLDKLHHKWVRVKYAYAFAAGFAFFSFRNGLAFASVSRSGADRSVWNALNLIVNFLTDI